MNKTIRVEWTDGSTEMYDWSVKDFLREALDEIAVVLKCYELDGYAYE